MQTDALRLTTIACLHLVENGTGPVVEKAIAAIGRFAARQHFEDGVVSVLVLSGLQLLQNTWDRKTVERHALRELNPLSQMSGLQNRKDPMQRMQKESKIYSIL